MSQQHPAARRQASIWSVNILAGLGLLAMSAVAMAENPVVTINNEFLNDTRLTSGLLVAGPPEVAREIAIIDGAMFDAANAGSGQPFKSAAYDGNAIKNASVDAAALTAGYIALKGIFANSIWLGAGGVGGSAAIQAKVLGTIDATYAAALSGLGIGNPSACGSPAGPSPLCNGIALGRAAGNANLAKTGYTVGNNSAYATDGSATAILNGITNPYVPANANPGTYIPTTARPAMFPRWGAVTPTGLTPNQLDKLVDKVPGPPAINSAAYANGLLQTECTGSGLGVTSVAQAACASAGFAPATTAQAKAALFWNDPGTTEQPPGHWLDIMDTLAKSQNLSTLQAARLGSALGQAENDAGIGAWTVKYQDALWRPITAIGNCATGAGAAAGSVTWNAHFNACDPNWTSLIATPPHPDYLAGHPTFSGAAATVIGAFFGTDNISFSSTSDTYCNGGTPWRSQTTNLVAACTVTNGSFSPSNAALFFGSAAACTEAGGALSPSSGNPTGCTLGGVTYAFRFAPTASGCNDLVTGGANDSPLICPITEIFATISSASSGPDGSEFSRVAGGIHTPFAVADALALGNAIGAAIAKASDFPKHNDDDPLSITFGPVDSNVVAIVSSDQSVPEPGAIMMLLTSMALLRGIRRRLRPRV